MYNMSIAPAPWRVRRDPKNRHLYQVCCYECPDAIEVLPATWTDSDKAQEFADAANELYSKGVTK